MGWVSHQAHFKTRKMFVLYIYFQNLASILEGKYINFNKLDTIRKIT